MCNHYRASQRALDLAHHRALVTEGPGWEITEGAWPQKQMPVVYSAGQPTLTSMRWGIWPFYEPKFTTIANSRDDKLLSLSLWKTSAAKRRCLIPADGFFEWTGPKGGKWEVLFHLPDNRPFFFAGIWGPDPDGKSRGFSMVTCKPNALLAALPHDRMPVILPDEKALEWLGSEPLPDEQLLGLCQPFAGELIRHDLPPPPPRASITKKALKSADADQIELL